MEFFEELFASDFGKLKTIAYEIEFEELNTMKLDKKKENEIRYRLDSNKFEDPDQNGNLLLKRTLKSYDKSLTFLFQTIINKQTNRCAMLLLKGFQKATIEKIYSFFSKIYSFFSKKYITSFRKYSFFSKIYSFYSYPC